jgi:ABC-type polysaccharide/polyol phosphate transport system ATPase subunit
MSDVILKVENVSKLYRLGTVGTGTFGGDVQRFWKTKILGQEDPFLKIGQTNDRTSKEKTEFVWALKDINFEVKRGEVIGIIGKNGAGKSTLLKLLSRITSPTTGSIKSAGRMASLLEVGTGFHPELTGRENIFLNGAILGMTKKEIQSKFDEIVDFSGCELYIDTPTKRYSSGMTVRLGFAVAAFLDPEILVVDEVLAVGDAEFQRKAIGKMKEVSSGGGRTVLFVSHNMESVAQLCNTAMLMSNGMIEKTGKTLDVISHYLKKEKIIGFGPVYDTNTWKQIKYDNFQQGLTFISVERLNKTELIEDRNLIVRIIFGNNISKQIKNAYIGFHIHSSDKTIASGISKIGDVKDASSFDLAINLDNIVDGEFYMTFWLGQIINDNNFIDFDLVSEVMKFIKPKRLDLPWSHHWGKNLLASEIL